MLNSSRCVLLLLMVLLPALAGTGCSRTHYRLRADRQTYRILDHKTAGTPWMPPRNFTIMPRPNSRFFDPTPPDHPLLPWPAPQLYAYQLPEMRKSDSARSQAGDTQAEGPESEGPEAEGPETNRPETNRHETIEKPRPDPSPSRPPAAQETFQRRIESAPHAGPGAEGIRPVFFQADIPSGEREPSEGTGQEQLPSPPAKLETLEAMRVALEMEEEGDELTIAEIPRPIWQSLPDSCLRRMTEFASVREEYERSFGQSPGEAYRDDAPRLALEDIVEQGLLNSREYQAAKEQLYRAALELTLLRYDYALKFTPFGNGTDVDYRHNRNAGITVNELDVNTRFAGEQALATGGNLLASFANAVLLTFNGSDGFDADISSELLLSLSQTVFQRDIQLEALTQAERNVVYAARDFARFRKIFFRDLAASYYQLLLAYRGIEINTLDYFTNLRAFYQGEAEFGVGRLSRVQVDQIEQQALNSRSSLIASCNSLESALDRLKLDLGLPTETPINIDLSELETLTGSDETTVRSELVRRVRRNLAQELRSESPDRITMLNYNIELIRRMLALADRDAAGVDTGLLNQLLADMRVDEARILVALNRAALQRELGAATPSPPPQIFERTMDLVRALLDLVKQQLLLAAERQLPLEDVRPVYERRARLRAARIALRETLNELIQPEEDDERLEPDEEELELPELARIPELVEQAQELLRRSEQLADDAAEMTGRFELSPNEERERTLGQVQRVLDLSEETLSGQEGELAPIEIDMDAAMLTALVRRFDVMNERGFLADNWRRIKLAGDDLRSILDLNATQIVRTESGVNRPFAFTFDDSQTRLSLSLDTPVNRRAQRNAYRRSLINYNAALRSLMQLEDGIKFDIRENLRDLQLNREQYRIAVASAALAFERVTSTRTQLELGIAGVAARDFLEAQTAYTNSLRQVAGQHITFITTRIDLFLNLESLEVDEEGMWPQLNREDYQPQPHYFIPSFALPVYGRLPKRVWHSHTIKSLMHVPPGQPAIYRSQAERDRPPADGEDAAGQMDEAERLAPEELPPADAAAPPTLPPEPETPEPPSAPPALDPAPPPPDAVAPEETPSF